MLDSTNTDTFDAASTSGVFPLPGAVGTLYQISAQQWTAINKQVAAVVEAQPIGRFIAEIIPNYPTLLPVCIKWQSQTYQSLIAHAVLVGIFAAGVPGVLSRMQQDTAAMADADAPSPNQQFLWRVQFEAFANHAGAVETSVAALTPDIAAFVAENQAADVTLEQIANSLPPEWQSIAGPISDLDNGFAAVRGGWSGISQQLQALAAGHVAFNTVGEVRAAVATATPAWTALNQSATAFDQHATGENA
jgi:hypothetical protein